MVQRRVAKHVGLLPVWGQARHRIERRGDRELVPQRVQHTQPLRSA